MAVSLPSNALALALGVDSALAVRILPVATALVERFAPAAPEAIQNEAVIRVSGWLAEQPAAAIRSDKIGDLETAFAPTHTSALRHSGAMALLSPWKVRRAGVVA